MCNQSSNPGPEPTEAPSLPTEIDPTGPVPRSPIKDPPVHPRDPNDPPTPYTPEPPAPDDPGAPDESIPEGPDPSPLDA